MAIIIWLIGAGVIHLVVRGLGGKGTFRQAFGIYGWAWMPMFFGTIAKGVYALVVRNFQQSR